MTTDERLTRIDDKLEQILKFQAALVEVCAAREKRTVALESTTYGNGRDGLVREVQALKTVREIRGKGFWALVGLVAAVVSGGLLLLGETALVWVRS